MKKLTATMGLFAHLLNCYNGSKLTMDGCDNESAAWFIHCHVERDCPIDGCGGVFKKVETRTGNFFMNECMKCGTRKSLMFNTPLEGWKHGLGKGVFIILAWLCGEPYENIKNETQLTDNAIKKLISKLEEYDLNDLPIDTNLTNAVFRMQMEKREKSNIVK